MDKLRLLTVRDLAGGREKGARGLLPINRVTLHRWCRDGKFPRPMKIGGRLAWRAVDYERWLDEQAKATKA
jgi:predicted DNA-binding transcriptional regulator AlpA